MRLPITGKKDVSTTVQSSQGTVDSGGDYESRCSRQTLAVALLCGVIASIAICGPLIGRGWLLMLDWISGPHPNVPRGLYGLDGGLNASPVLHLGRSALGMIAGQETASWLWLALLFPIFFVAMAMLIPGSPVAKLAGGALYALNPMVVDRVWTGHFGFLAGYAILPLLLRSLMINRNEHGLKRLRPVLWISLAGGLSPHFFWICAVLVATVTFIPRVSRRSILWCGFLGIGVIATSMYLLSSTGTQATGFEVGNADISAYASRATTPLGTFGSVLMLSGFWRPDALMPDVPFALLAICAAVAAPLMAIGAVALYKTNRAYLYTLGAVGVVAYLLALGTRGPTGWLFSWMFDNVPGFAIMREPQKFVGLLALSYACLFAAGVAYVVERVRNVASKSFVIVISGSLPLLLASNMFLAFGGHIKASEFPESWKVAQQEMGHGDGALLFLPWHLYSQQSFTQGRVVAQPAETYFERPVIQGDNVELPNIPTASLSPRSAYIEGLLSKGRTINSFGQLVAPLGVEYIALNKNADFGNYSWLIRQPDLTAVFDKPDFTLLRNNKFAGVGYATSREVVASGLDELIDISNGQDLSGAALVTSSTGHTAQTVNDAVEQRSAVEYELPPTSAQFSLREPYDRGWTQTEAAQRALSGTILTESNAKGLVEFEPWARLKILYALSVVAVLALLLASHYQEIHKKLLRRRVA